jgi:CDP-glucose 4,6-dehydratase
MKNLFHFYKNKKILITGATGFKGAWLCSILLILGAKVYGTGFKNRNKKSFFYKLNLAKKINLKLFDIRDYKKVDNFILQAKPSIIFHLAGQPLIYKSYQNPALTFEINTIGTINILDAAINKNFVKSIVFITSDNCYEINNKINKYKETDRLGGLDPYSASKASSEIIIKFYKESFFKNKKICGLSSARAGNIIGGGDFSKKRLIPDIISFIKKNSKIKLRNPSFVRPWQFILDPLFGYLILAKAQYLNPNKFSGAWNFGPTDASYKSVKEIVKLFIKKWGSGTLKKTASTKFYEHKIIKLNINKAKSKLNWKPKYNLNKSISATVDWYYKVLKEKKDISETTMRQIRKYI